MKGSCLCGSIVYEADQLNTPIQHCACSTCRKAHAAAFNTGAGVLREHFRWISGQELLSSYESSPGKLRYFCSKCGSQLISDKQGLHQVIVRVATLDDDPGVQPSWKMWQSHAVPWLAHGDDLPAYPEGKPAD